MNKLITRLIPAAAALLLAHGVLAAEAGQAAADAALAEQQAQDATQAAREPANCLKETGTRIKRSDKQACVAAPGQSFTRDDIERTGELNTADALRKLSPTVH